MINSIEELHKTEGKSKDLSSFSFNVSIMTSSTKSPKKTKRSSFKDIWERHISSELDLKIWVPGPEYDYNKKIGIGLGTRTKVKSVKKPRMFSFVTIDKDSIDRLINAINESIFIRNKNFLLPNSIISKKHLILDYLRKISITILVKRTDKNFSIILMINSKQSLYTVISDSDIEWIISTLELAKYNLSDTNDNWKYNDSSQSPNTTNVNNANKRKNRIPIKVSVDDTSGKLSDNFFKDS